MSTSASLSPEEQLLLREALGRTTENSSDCVNSPDPITEPKSLGNYPHLPSPQSNASLSSSAPESKYFTLADAFPNAAVFLMFFDSSLRTGVKMLYPWQIEELMRLSEKDKWKIDHKLLYYLKANNGSGKDAFIIAGIVCYVLCCWKRYKIVVTSSSDNQLDTQTRVYIKDIAQNVNAYMRTVWGWEVDAISIKSETFKAAPGFTGTEVYTFVSKEGGKVEGYHPFPDADPKEGCIVIINEAKSIPEEIHQHLKKCTYNIWIEVSSAGESSGHFSKATTSENTIYYPREPEAFRPFCRVITYKDTPHKIREAEEAIKEFGEDHPFVKNTYLSKDSSLGAQVAITEESLDSCIRLGTGSRIVIGAGKHAGLDFAAGGGDECSFYVFDENTLIAAESWRVRDTEVTEEILIGDGVSQGLFAKYGFTKAEAEKIVGDDNGLGEPIINGLHKKGWCIGRIKNQGSARRKDRYLNRGAELYGSFSRIIAGGFINFNRLLPAKAKLQLQNRHYSIEGQAKYKLWPKEDESESPDHADAIVLAWSQWTVLDFLDDKVKKPIGPRTPAPMITTAEIVKATYHHNMKWQLEGAIGRDKPRGVNFRNPITSLRSLYD